jgi:hypothetical protein
MMTSRKPFEENLRLQTARFGERLKPTDFRFDACSKLTRRRRIILLNVAGDHEEVL